MTRVRRREDARTRVTDRQRALALEEPNAGCLLNGRCVGRLEYVEGFGTVLVMTWHERGCEHEQGPGVKGR